MECSGEIIGFTLDYDTGKPIVQIRLTDRSKLSALEDLRGNLLRVAIQKFRKKRSVSANNYFHSLCGQISHALTISPAKCKNILIGRYGYPEYADEETHTPMVIKTNIPPERMLEYEEPHCRVAQGGDENTWFYYVMRNSRTYNTEEFSRLLEGTISEAQELGIDTITENEKTKMLERWAKEYEERTV